MVSDQEPRYRLVDSDGNIVGSLYGKADGSIAIQETDSGSDREVTLAPDGTFSAPSVETESVTTDELGRGEGSLITSDGSWTAVTSSVSENLDDVSSDSYVPIGNGSGGIPGDVIPDGATLYGLWHVQASDVPDGEELFTKPQVQLASDGSLNTVELDELELVTLPDDPSRPRNTGWTEITSLDPTNGDLLLFQEVRARVTGGTASFFDGTWRHHLAFEWRVD